MNQMVSVALSSSNIMNQNNHKQKKERIKAQTERTKIPNGIRGAISRNCLKRRRERRTVESSRCVNANFRQKLGRARGAVIPLGV